MVLYKVRSVGHEGTSAFTHTFTFSYVSLEIRRRRSFRSLSSPRLASPPKVFTALSRIRRSFTWPIFASTM